MDIIEKCNKPINRFFFTLVLFVFITILLGSPIRGSIENILLSRAKVHSQAYDFALTPVPEQKQEYNVNKHSLVSDNSSFRDQTIVTSDARITALKQFLLDYNSPMAPYASVFVTEADKYGLDWRLVTAISGVESAFGVIAVRENNAWGWKGGSDGDFNPFSTWEDGIKHVTERMALGYGVDMTPFEIEPIYCPPCGQNPDHLWANGVIKFMDQIDMYLYGF